MNWRGTAIEALRVARRALWRVVIWSVDAERRLRDERGPRIVVVCAPGRNKRGAERPWN